MLDTDGVQLAVVDVVLAGGAVHVALVQLNPESVACRLDVLPHVGAPAGEVDALEAGVEARCTSEVKKTLPQQLSPTINQNTYHSEPTKEP